MSARPSAELLQSETGRAPGTLLSWLKIGDRDLRDGRAITGKLPLLFVLGDVLGAGIYALVGEVAAEPGGVIWLPM
jgi:hypothetical protein